MRQKAAACSGVRSRHMHGMAARSARRACVAMGERQAMRPWLAPRCTQAGLTWSSGLGLALREAVVEFSPLAFAVVQPALPVQLGHLPHRRVAEVEGVRKASAGGRSGGRIHWSVARHSQHVAFHSHNAPGVKGERVGNGNRTPSNVRLFEHRADCVFVRAYACVVYVPAPARVYHAARLPPPAERPCADRAAHHSQQPEVRALHLLVPWPA